MIGRKLSHYSVVAKIGEGGMGAVYRAEDERLRRDVALKVLPEEVARDPDRLQRFRREAELMAALDHPNIVTVYSVEEDEGTHFLTMALVEGVSLGEHLRKGGLDPKRFFEIAEALADALAAAHERGITHRDLKPANLMISSDGRLKVLDFGLAKLQPPTLREGTALPTQTQDLTTDGQVLGTLPYMSPEQLEGRPVDHRSDIFSLGAVLYEMATGARPFEGESHAALASAILRDQPPRVEGLRSDLPRHVSRIIGHCLEKDPADRFQTARDVFNQLRGLREEDGAEAASAAFGSEVAEVASGKRRLGGVAVVVGMAVLAGAAGWLGSRLSSSEADGKTPAAVVSESAELARLAVLPFQNLGAPEDEFFAAGVTDEIGSRLAGVEGLSLRSRSSVLQYDRTGKTVPQMGSELGVAYVLDGTVRWAPSADEGASRVRITPQLVRVADDTPIWSQNYERTIEDIFEVQSEIAENVADALGLTLLDEDRASAAARGTDRPEAVREYLRGREALEGAIAVQARGELEVAIPFFENAIAVDPDFALAYAQLATAHAYQSHWYFDRSEERLAKVEEYAQHALELAPDLAEARLALSYYHRDRFDYDLALEQLDLARRSRPGDSEIVGAMAEIQWFKGDAEEAIATYQRASEIDPRKGALYCMAGGAHRMLYETDASRRLHERAIDLVPDRACAYRCLAYLELDQRGVEAAREYLESIPPALAMRGLPTPELAWFLVDTILGRYDEVLERLDSHTEPLSWQQYFYPRSLLRAQVLGLMGREEDSRREYEEARVEIEALLEERPADERLHGSLGLAFAGLGLEDEAVRAGRRAAEMLPVEKDRFSGAHRLRDLALIYVQLGRHEEAVETLEKLFAGPSEIHVVEIRLDPLFAPLLEFPRFRNLRHVGHDCTGV